MYNMLHHIYVLIYDLTNQDLEPYNTYIYIYIGPVVNIQN